MTDSPGRVLAFGEELYKRWEAASNKDMDSSEANAAWAAWRDFLAGWAPALLKLARANLDQIVADATGMVAALQEIHMEVLDDRLTELPLRVEVVGVLERIKALAHEGQLHGCGFVDAALLARTFPKAVKAIATTLEITPEAAQDETAMYMVLNHRREYHQDPQRNDYRLVLMGLCALAAMEQELEREDGEK